LPAFRGIGSTSVVHRSSPLSAPFATSAYIGISLVATFDSFRGIGSYLQTSLIATFAVELCNQTMMVPLAKLNNGALIPLLGLGTWKAAPGVVKEAVTTAIQAGYRHIDCAHVYGNEREIGDALTECITSGVCSRSDLFITSKLWNDSHAQDEVRPALQHTLQQLQLDYLDMYLGEYIGIA
jgi:Aldo/keto reductase family